MGTTFQVATQTACTCHQQPFKQFQDMKKIPVALLILLCSVLFTNGAIAQNKPLACQVDASAGLNWENGRWVTKSFVTNKFILVQAGNTLTTDSVAKALKATLKNVSCRNAYPQIDCTDVSGGGLYFDPRVLRGGISQLIGSTDSGSVRDTVTVEIFSCTPF